MSSSLNSSSSSRVEGGAPTLDEYTPLHDVTCEVAVVLGTGQMSVRECLYLKPQTIIPLAQAAGADLQMTVNGVAVAHGEVVVLDDSTALRLNGIVPPPSAEDIS